MIKDEIVEQVRKVREELAARMNFDLKAILADARKRQKRSGHRLVSFHPKPKKTFTGTGLCIGCSFCLGQKGPCEEAGHAITSRHP